VIGRLTALLRRELWSYFFTPLAWVVLTLFLLVQGYGFYLYVELINRPDAPHGQVMQYFFGGTFLYWLFLIFIVSAITMRLIAEERRLGTVEPLMTAPVSAGEVVVAKYLAAVLFYGFLWLPTLAYVAVLAGLLPESTVLDWGPIAAGYLGTLAVGAAFISVGLLASALCRSQIVAAMLCFVALSLLVLLGALEPFVSRPGLRAVLAHVNLFQHMEDFARGIVDSRAVVLLLSVVVFCLVAAARALEARKWR
jgi:ABC-2 type transport system permease protein